MSENPDELDRAFEDLHRDVEQQADAHGAPVEAILVRAGLPDLVEDAATAEGWALVHAAQAGDPAAFGRLHDLHHDTVFRFVLDRLGDRAAAEDLAQDTFLRAYRHLAGASRHGDVGAWLLAVAHTLVLESAERDDTEVEVTERARHHRLW